MELLSFTYGSERINESNKIFCESLAMESLVALPLTGWNFKCENSSEVLVVSIKAVFSKFLFFLANVPNRLSNDAYATL